MKTAIYTRVSTNSQTTDNQLRELKRFAESRGWSIVKQYDDSGYSGDSKNRPGFDEMMNDAHKGMFKTILIFQLSRFGRSMSEVIRHVTELNQIGIGVHSYTENLSTADDSPYSKLILGVFSALGEIELNLIRERVRAGVKRAQENGVKFGRPHKGFDLGEAIKLREQGFSLRKAAKKLGISAATLKNRLSQISTAQKVDLQNLSHIAK